MMLAQQIQEIKQLTFEELCPKWSAILRKYDWHQIAHDETPYSIGNSARCIVGEAHGFDDSYTQSCGACTRFSFLFVHHNERNSTRLEQFTKHFNEVHRK